MRARIAGLLVALLATTGALANAPERNSTMEKTQDDREMILEHIHGIFEAFLRKDRETLRRTHAHDWIGFLGPSVKIERGIEEYMKGAERSLESFHGTGYELTDTEVRIHGDIAVVYYTARYDYKDKEGNHGSLPLRSLDLYRRTEGEWIQIGSHITPVPKGGSWGEGEQRAGPRSEEAPPRGAERRVLSEEELSSLLAEREAVWRGWFSGDREHLRKVLPGELIAIDPGVEEWSDKEQTLRNSAEFVAGGGKLIDLRFPKTEVLAYGDVAVLFTTYLFEIERAGERTTTSGRGTEVFVRRGGRWLNSGWHLDSGR